MSDKQPSNRTKKKMKMKIKIKQFKSRRFLLFTFYSLLITLLQLNLVISIS